MTMKNRIKHIALLGAAQAILAQQELLAGNSHCLDSDGSVIELEKAHEYRPQPAPSDIDEKPKPPNTYRKPRSKYAPHMGAKELRRLSQND